MLKIRVWVAQWLVVWRRVELTEENVLTGWNHRRRSRELVSPGWLGMLEIPLSRLAVTCVTKTGPEARGLVKRPW